MKSNQHSVPSFFDNLFGIEAIDKFVAKEFGFIDELEQEAQGQGKAHFEKLQQRACDLLDQVELQPEKLNQELALLCDRYDVSEELVRLKTHLAHLENLLKELEVGKKGEFMLQEILREVNTLSSKSNNALISRIAVDFKNELEKMREQLLNLE